MRWQPDRPVVGTLTCSLINTMFISYSPLYVERAQLNEFMHTVQVSCATECDSVTPCRGLACSGVWQHPTLCILIGNTQLYSCWFHLSPDHSVNRHPVASMRTKLFGWMALQRTLCNRNIYAAFHDRQQTEMANKLSTIVATRTSKKIIKTNQIWKTERPDSIQQQIMRTFASSWQGEDGNSSVWL